MERTTPTSTLIDFAHGRISPDESIRILEAVEHDPQASAELNLVVALMNEAGDPRSEVFAVRESVRARALTRHLRQIWETLRDHPIVAPVGALGSVALTLVLLIVLNSFTASRYDELTGIDRTAFTWNARGTDNSDIAGAYFSFTNGDYDKCLILLERFLHQDPRGVLSPYVHYTAGAVELISSQRTYLTIVHIRDQSRIERGLEHLLTAVELTSDPRLIEESRYLRSKGYLMLGRPDAAIAELDYVRALDGPRSQEARQMIERIHALTP